LNYASLDMSRVTKIDLGVYLERANNSSLPKLRTFYSCLAIAFKFYTGRKFCIKISSRAIFLLRVERSCL
jgi:hypothetical protein